MPKWINGSLNNWRLHPHFLLHCTNRRNLEPMLRVTEIQWRSPRLAALASLLIKTQLLPDRKQLMQPTNVPLLGTTWELKIMILCPYPLNKDLWKCAPGISIFSRDAGGSKVQPVLYLKDTLRTFPADTSIRYASFLATQSGGSHKLFPSPTSSVDWREVTVSKEPKHILLTKQTAWMASFWYRLQFIFSPGITFIIIPSMFHHLRKEMKTGLYFEFEMFLFQNRSYIEDLKVKTWKLTALLKGW